MTELYKYQREIVNSQNKPSAGLFMEPGTGKTITSLALFQKSKQPKILVICVLSKLEDWKEDLKKEVNVDSIILNKGTAKNKEILLKNEVDSYIINFESTWRLIELLTWTDKNTYVIIDESHKIKNVKSKIGKFCAKLKFKTNTKCILTGTPQSKKYIDYYNQLSFIDVIDAPYKMFTDVYCVYELQKYNGFPFKQLIGYKNTNILDKIINDNCVFFKRELTNDEIPIEIDITLKKPDKYDYFKRVRVYEDYIADNVSKLFVTMRKMCSGNIDKYEIDTQKITWLKDLCENLNDRLVIFYNFNFERDAIIKLMEQLKIPYSQYNGDVKDLNNFNKYNNGIAICQYMSASLGLNDFVKANICVLYSPSLNYIDYVQSKKRIDRIGQTKKPLFYNLYCKGTVEEKILKTIKKGITFDMNMFETYMNEIAIKEVKK